MTPVPSFLPKSIKGYIYPVRCDEWFGRLQLKMTSQKCSYCSVKWLYSTLKFSKCHSPSKTQMNRRRQTLQQSFGMRCMSFIRLLTDVHHNFVDWPIEFLFHQSAKHPKSLYKTREVSLFACLPLPALLAACGITITVKVMLPCLFHTCPIDLIRNGSPIGVMNHDGLKI